MKPVPIIIEREYFNCTITRGKYSCLDCIHQSICKYYNFIQNIDDLPFSLIIKFNCSYYLKIKE